MQIKSNKHLLAKIKQSPLAAKYPKLLPAALAYTLLQRRAGYLDNAFYTWFQWEKTKEGYKYWINISRTL